jgi:N-acyl-D-aspartate/D-glutamate deacylase
MPTSNRVVGEYVARVSDVLVRNGTLVDGTGAPRRRADVRIRGGRVAEIDDSLHADGEVELDATDAFVTPGFIDTHTHLDPSLFWDPGADPMPQHGVTTVLLGNCSLSLAPLRAEHRDQLVDVFSFVEDVPAEAFADGVPWSWETWAEYRDAMRARAFAVNAAGMVGHTPLRLFVMGEDAWTRIATDDERRAMAEVLDDSLRDGAFGLTTSRFDHDRANRPVPSQLADDDELAALLDVLAARGRFLEFIPDLLSPCVGDDIDRYARLCGPRGVAATWNVLAYQEQDRGVLARQLLAQAAAQHAQGTRFYPQVSPRTIDVQVNWSSSILFTHLPEGWHQIIRADPARMRELLADPAWRATARAEWDAVSIEAFPHRHPEYVRFVSVTRPEHDRWVGHTLGHLVAERGGHPSDVLADWVLENDLDPGLLAVLANADPATVGEMLRDPTTVVSASDAGAHLRMFCAAGDTTLLLSRHVRDRDDLTLEQAVWELSGRQAELFGFGDRGTITPGAPGDLAVFALGDLAWEPEVLVDDVPGGAARLRRPAGGFRYTVVAGEVTQVRGEATGALPGRFLDAG